MSLLGPKEMTIGDKTFLLGKFPATVGREIILQYPTSAMPKIGDYATNEALMLKMLSYVGVVVPDRDEPLVLNTRMLIDNHCASPEVLLRLEWAMMEHNFSFFGQGKLSGILERVATQAVALIQKTLTDLSRASSGKGAQP